MMKTQYRRPSLKHGEILVGKKSTYKILAKNYKPPAGANGIVYFAIDEQSRKGVAVKLFSPLEQKSQDKLEYSQRQFRNEIVKTQSIEHWSILRILDWGRNLSKNSTYLFSVTEKADEDLRTRLKRKIGILNKLLYSTQLCDAAAYFNSKGLIHRDIKPENILIFGSVAKIGDLGISRFLPQFERTMAKDMNLYSEYMDEQRPAHYFSPEQLRIINGEKNVDLAYSDIFQLGKVIHEVFTGVNPTGQLHRGSQLYKLIPTEVVTVIFDMLSEDPKSRPPFPHCTTVFNATLAIELKFLMDHKDFYKEIRLLKEFFMNFDSAKLNRTSLHYSEPTIKKLENLKILSSPKVDSLDWYQDSRIFQLTERGLAARDLFLSTQNWRNFEETYANLNHQPTALSIDYARDAFKKNKTKWDMSKIHREIDFFFDSYSEQKRKRCLVFRPIGIAGRIFLEIHCSPFGMLGNGYGTPQKVLPADSKVSLAKIAATYLRKLKLSEKTSKVLFYLCGNHNYDCIMSINYLLSERFTEEHLSKMKKTGTLIVRPADWPEFISFQLFPGKPMIKHNLQSFDQLFLELWSERNTKQHQQRFTAFLKTIIDQGVTLKTKYSPSILFALYFSMFGEFEISISSNQDVLCVKLQRYEARVLPIMRLLKLILLNPKEESDLHNFLAQLQSRVQSKITSSLSGKRLSSNSLKLTF